MHRRGAAIVMASCDRPHGGAGCRPQPWSRRCRSLLERTGTDRMEDRMNRLGSKGGDAALPRLQRWLAAIAIRTDGDTTGPTEHCRQPSLDLPLLFRNNLRLLACLLPTHRNRCRSVPKPCRPDPATSDDRRCRQPAPNQFIRFIRQPAVKLLAPSKHYQSENHSGKSSRDYTPHVDRTAVALNCDC